MKYRRVLMHAKLFSALIFCLLIQSCATTKPVESGAANAGSFNEKTRFQWTTGAPVILPQPEKGREVVSAKDPSVLSYNGKYYVFYTTCDTKGAWSMQFISFKDWKDANKAKAYPKDNNPNLLGYHCAPHVFYFTPQKKWYMVFQSGQPQYSTNDNIDNPNGWTKPVDFFKVAPSGLEKGQWGPEWLDFHVICDDKNAYLMFTGDNGRFYRSKTRLEDFPNGMSDPVLAIKGEDRGSVFEGSVTYNVKGTGKYLTIIEAFTAPTWDRFYRSWVADSLDGEWKEQAGTWENPFAGLMNVKFDEGVTPWTKDISHGELIRTGYDEKMELDPENIQFLFQGRAPESNGMQYHLLPYKIGLLKAVK
jgi:hypothetical protein